MGVADQRDPLGLAVQAELGEQRGEHVLPHRVARACVVEPDGPLPALRLQFGEEVQVLGVQHFPRPAHREARAAGEVLQGQLPEHREVVVAGEAHRDVRAGELHAGVRLSAVADEVAEAPHLGGVARGDVLEHRLEGVAVAVDV